VVNRRGLLRGLLAVAAAPRLLVDRASVAAGELVGARVFVGVDHGRGVCRDVVIVLASSDGKTWEVRS
jgi:hypothetical protein